MSHSIEVSEHAGVRYLHFSSDWIQGAMRLQRPNALELAYTREMMLGLLLREPPWPRNALMIGLGAGSLAKFIYHKLPETRITAVEINPQVETVARLHFKLPDDPARLRVAIGDGARFVARDAEAWDCILVDGFDENGQAGPLDAEPFYRACRERLAREGLLAVNLLRRARGFAACKTHLAEAFGGGVFVFPSGDIGNAVALARGAAPVDTDFKALMERAEAVRRQTGLNLTDALLRLRDAGHLPRDRLQF
jgi:spermidine synthase